jgi:hypothetical protein
MKNSYKLLASSVLTPSQLCPFGKRRAISENGSNTARERMQGKKRVYFNIKTTIRIFAHAVLLFCRKYGALLKPLPMQSITTLVLDAFSSKWIECQHLCTAPAEPQVLKTPGGETDRKKQLMISREGIAGGERQNSLQASPFQRKITLGRDANANRFC